MARNVNPKIAFYRQDSDHYRDPKMRLLIKDQDVIAYYIYHVIKAYGHATNGYFFDMNNEEQLEIFAMDECKADLALVKKVIDGCRKRSLFDEAIADRAGILTNEEMQESWIHATSERRKKGSVFEMRADLLLVKEVPEKIMIIHGKNGEFPVKNSNAHGNNLHTRQDDTETEKETNTKRDILAADAATTDNSISDPGLKATVAGKKESQGAGRKIFIPPQLQEIIDYFIEKKVNLRNPATWYEDRCRLEAEQFFNHYTANGWKQGRGKPIVDWKAAANNWLLNCKKGTFDAAVVMKGSDPLPVLPKENPALRSRVQQGPEADINFLYDRFIEDESTVTIEQIDTRYYDTMKKLGCFSFSDDKITEIKEKAASDIKLKAIPVTEDLLKMYMKKLGVLEHFRISKKAGAEAIFIQKD